LALNPYHPALRLHALEGRLSELDSLSINLSYRITIEFAIENHEIIPVNVGAHDGVYR